MRTYVFRSMHFLTEVPSKRLLVMLNLEEIDLEGLYCCLSSNKMLENSVSFFDLGLKDLGM